MTKQEINVMMTMATKILVGPSDAVELFEYTGKRDFDDAIKEAESLCSYEGQEPVVMVRGNHPPVKFDRHGQDFS